jgi:DNA transposition AAA+ family ATPase
MMKLNGNGHRNGAEGMSLKDQVAGVLARRGITQGQAAREAGMSETTLSQYRSDQYKGSIENVEKKLESWLRSSEESMAAQQLVPDAPSFFLSRTADELMQSFRYAQSIEDMVAVVGAPGIGKTSTCREYQRQYPNVWLATMASHTTGVVPVLAEIREAVGGGKANGATALAKEICRKISGTGGLLIIDEAHHVSIAALDAIRSLHDTTHTAIALVGSMEMSAKLERMPQLYSRLGLRLHRPRVLAADIQALLEAWGITGKGERRAITEVAKGAGGLRTATKVLRLASASARAAGESLTLQHIQDAAHTRGARIAEEVA